MYPQTQSVVTQHTTWWWPCHCTYYPVYTAQRPLITVTDIPRKELLHTKCIKPPLAAKSPDSVIKPGRIRPTATAHGADTAPPSYAHSKWHHAPATASTPQYAQHCCSNRVVESLRDALSHRLPPPRHSQNLMSVHSTEMFHIITLKKGKCSNIWGVSKAFLL